MVWILLYELERSSIDMIHKIEITEENPKNIKGE